MENALRGQSQYMQDSIVSQWRQSASRELQNTALARAIWEGDPHDSDARAWRETMQSLAKQSESIGNCEFQLALWHKRHAVQSKLLSYGVRSLPSEVKAWSDELAASEKFLAANKKTLEQLNKKWEAKRPDYVAGLERQNASTLEASAFVQLLDHDLKEHFQRFRQREVDKVEQQRELERQRSRSYDRGRGR